VDAIIEFVKGLLAREPARFVAYGAVAATWAVTQLGALLGVVVPDNVLLAVGTIVTFILTEIIRHLVYSPATVAAIKGDDLTTG